jgi:hypothetical protein
MKKQDVIDLIHNNAIGYPYPLDEKNRKYVFTHHLVI